MSPDGFANILKQAQNLQSEISRVQQELAQRTAEGNSGGGMVTATVDGRGRLKTVTIDPQSVDMSDLPMLQDLIVAAVNSAQEKMQREVQQEMEALTGGLPIPGLGL